MRIQYASDLHLEFAENRRFVASGGLEKSAEILVLAGDIAYFNAIDEADWFWDELSRNYEATYIVPGNHEYYHGEDVGKHRGSWCQMLRDNVGYYNNRLVHLDGETDLILTTLWGAIDLADPLNVFTIQRYLNDFGQIRYDGRGFTPEDFDNLFRESFAFLKEAFEVSRAKHRVVVTHHVPTLRAVNPHYRASKLTEVFAVELRDFIETSEADAWIYGHSHANIELTIGKTALLSNQLGYVKRGEQKSFTPGKTFELL